MPPVRLCKWRHESRFSRNVDQITIQRTDMQWCLCESIFEVPSGWLFKRQLPHLSPSKPFLHRCDHSAAFLKAKHLHTPQHAIVLCNIDYLTITYRLMWKDYDYLAELGADWGADWDEPRGEGRDVDNLKSKTGRFSEEDIGNSGRNEWQRYGRYVLRVSSTAKFYWRLRSHSYLFRITPSYFDFLLLVLFAHCNTRPITKHHQGFSRSI